MQQGLAGAIFSSEKKCACRYVVVHSLQASVWHLHLCWYSLSAFSATKRGYHQIPVTSPNSHPNLTCDPLSQNEHKIASGAIQDYYRLKFSIMQALKWYMIRWCSSLFCPAKINILWWFSFVFYCSVAWLTGYFSVYKLVTLVIFSDFVIAGHKLFLLCGVVTEGVQENDSIFKAIRVEAEDIHANLLRQKDMIDQLIM